METTAGIGMIDPGTLLDIKENEIFQLVVPVLVIPTITIYDEHDVRSVFCICQFVK